MSAIALADRSAGDTILAAFFQDIKSILGGDFMGRDVNGNPASGNNCGTSAYPWGVGYFTQLVLGGVALTTTQLERPPYQIVSGKTRSSGNQPQFLQPAGSAATFNLLASSVNLVLTINGVSKTWTADYNSIPVTVAPSTQNTALVNDATAAAQAATRTWGEYGSGAPYYGITISTVGTNISNRIGSFQAFKIGTEYFLAYVESATSLTRAFRGFFFDSSGNPVKRATFSNGATITLMNLGYVFADIDGATVDTIFTGLGVNNAPTFAYTAPTSPASGDYWFDQANQVWKRWSGAAWVIVSRILVGMVVADSTNCVAARSGDFFGLCRPDNTIELGAVTNTTVKAAGALARINVNGNSRLFTTNLPKWDTASNLAASTDRYNAAVTASVVEYFYITDQGDVKISDMEPYWRADLLGWYHPYNPWRSVGQNTPDGSANFQSTTLRHTVQFPSNANFQGNSVQENGKNLVVSNANASASLAIIRGTVDSSGAIVVGEGFTANNPSTGNYTITFTTAFFAAPSVVITTDQFSNGLVWNVSARSTSAFSIQGYSNVGAPGVLVSAGFNFIVIGIRA